MGAGATLAFAARPQLGRQLGLLCIGALVLAGSVFLLLSPAAYERLSWLAGWKAWGAALVGIPLSLAAMIVSVRGMTNRAVAIRIDEEGVSWRRWAVRPIPWPEIVEGWRWQVRGQPFLCLRLRDPAAWRPRGLLLRAGSGINRAMSGSDVQITRIGLDRGFDDMMAAFDGWRRAVPRQPSLPNAAS